MTAESPRNQTRVGDLAPLLGCVSVRGAVLSKLLASYTKNVYLFEGTKIPQIGPETSFCGVPKSYTKNVYLIWNQKTRSPLRRRNQETVARDPSLAPRSSLVPPAKSAVPLGHVRCVQLFSSVSNARLVNIASRGKAPPIRARGLGRPDRSSSKAETGTTNRRGRRPVLSVGWRRPNALALGHDPLTEEEGRRGETGGGRRWGRSRRRACGRGRRRGSGRRGGARR